nr:4-hydroxy-3-methylbut-2-enyl diphosphate reductase [uncultured Romboutsia sp.]
MKVKIAKEAGFCFGVKRAMKMAWDELEINSDIYALGPLIHNKQAVQRYEEKGLVTVDTINDIPNNKNVVIRSHGVSKDTYDKANSNNLNIIDTTCPFVKKIHNIVKEFYEKGYKIIIIGDKNHPEVIGINGWCENSALIVKSIDDVNSLSLDNNSKYCVVSQTTLNLELYNKIVNTLSKKLDNITFKNTICSATKTRQQAAKELSVDVDCMIVIGGKHSSNTQKLVNICKEQVPTFAIETKEDLDIDKLNTFNVIGVTAGASTPDWIIEDVINFIESL